MPEDKFLAALLTGYQFFRHPENNTHGILRLDTKGEPCWLLVTRNALLQLGETCVKLAEDLEAVSKIGCQARSSSSSVLASFRSSVSKPSMNQP